MIGNQKDRSALVLAGELRTAQFCFPSIIETFRAGVGEFPSTVVLSVPASSIPTEILKACERRGIETLLVPPQPDLSTEVRLVGSQFAIWRRAREGLRELLEKGRVSPRSPVMLTRPDLFVTSTPGPMKSWSAEKAVLHGAGFSGHFTSRELTHQPPTVALRRRTGWKRRYFVRSQWAKEVFRLGVEPDLWSELPSRRILPYCGVGFPDQLFFGQHEILFRLAELTTSFLELELLRQLAGPSEILSQGRSRRLDQRFRNTLSPDAARHLFRPPTSLQPVGRFDRRVPVFVFSSFILGIDVKPINDLEYVIVRDEMKEQ